jgi:PAS domain-containing protein
MKKLLVRRFLQPPRASPPPPAGGQELDVRTAMASTQRELARFASDMLGAQGYLGQFARPRVSDRQQIDCARFRALVEDTAQALLIIDPRAGLHIVEANDAYGTATLTTPSRIAGQKLFDVFPDNPDLPDADGVSNLFQSIRRVAQTGRDHTMAPQRYDVRDASGAFVMRTWQCTNIPVFDTDGNLAYIVHQANELQPPPA